MPPKKEPKATRSRPKHTTSSPPSAEEYNCVDCDGPDSADNMVQCDVCQTWHHFSCAGVDSFIQNENWVCGTSCAITAGKCPPLSSVVREVVPKNAVGAIMPHNGPYTVPNDPDTAANNAVNPTSKFDLDSANALPNTASETQCTWSCTMPNTALRSTTSIVPSSINNILGVSQHHGQNFAVDTAISTAACTEYGAACTAPPIDSCTAPPAISYNEFNKNKYTMKTCLNNTFSRIALHENVFEAGRIESSLYLDSRRDITLRDMQPTLAHATTDGISRSMSTAATFSNHLSNIVADPARTFSRGAIPFGKNAASYANRTFDSISRSDTPIFTMPPTTHAAFVRDGTATQHITATAPVTATATSISNIANSCSGFNAASTPSIVNSYPSFNELPSSAVAAIRTTGVGVGVGTHGANVAHGTTSFGSCISSAAETHVTDAADTAIHPALHSTKVLLKENPIVFLNQRRSSSNFSISSRGSRTAFERNIQMELQLLSEERKLKEKRDNEYLEKKYKILSKVPMEDGSSVTDAEVVSITKVNKWLGDDSRKPLPQSMLIHKGLDPGQGHPIAPKLQPNGRDWDLTRSWPGNLCKPNETSTEIQHDPVVSQNSTFNIPPPQQQLPPQASYAQQHQQFPAQSLCAPPQQRFPPQALLTPLPATEPFLQPNVSEPQNRSLSKNQIAARHLMSKDLPSFDGNPEQWPLFISSFERSTELCGFTDEENVMRLNKALTGKAKTAVRWFLLQPNCFHQVMSRLKTLYGRPELIIQTLLQKVNTIPPPKDGKLETILNFALEVQNLYATIQATGLHAHLNNPSLLTQLEGKLPPTILLNWGIYKMMLPDCTLSHFSAWIYQLAEAANGVLVPLTQTPFVESKGTSRVRELKQKSGFLNTHSQVETNNNESKHKCYICKGSCSSVAVCKQFQQLSRTSKWATIREYQLCGRCLKKHNIRNCPSTSVCGKDNCTFKHHPLLHNDQKSNVAKPINEENLEVKGNISVHMKSHCNAHPNDCESTLFRIVPVFLYGNGSQLKTFAFLDDGSSLTLMDEELANQLNMKGKPQPLCLRWTGNTQRYENQSQLLTLRISSTIPNAEIYSFSDVHTVKNLSLPYQSVNFEDLQSKYEHLKGLPIESYNNQSPRLLIGLKHTKLGLPLKCREGKSEEPIATKTRLGWLVHGGCSQQLADRELRYQNHNFHICECNDAGLQRLVKDYICMDNFGISNTDKVLMPTDDKHALDQLDANTVRKNGRFETSLLWKFDDFAIPNSLPMAKRRLACLHKRMKREPQLSKSLDEKIKQFITKGYARKLTKEEIAERGDRCWYLPIFPVFNPNKPGKLRIVWDAAATVQGISLKSMLLRGPGQLASLVAVLFKFREDLVAIFADIMEMYHQIQIRKEDQHFQRFLWSVSEEVEPEVIAMQVMIMGATSASASAQYVIRKNADEFSAKFPRAVQSIKNNQYVDDLMDSTSSEEKAIQLAKEICYVHLQGGFFIRNWISNSHKVVKAMKSEPTNQVDLALDMEMGTKKVLGMWWCTASDCFTYKINASTIQADILSGHRRPTKREILRILMTIFDPLGLLAHFLMYIKVLLQDIWRSNIGWDEEVKDAEHEKWLKWVRYLPDIVKLKIPRCYIINNLDPSSETQLHIFVDASENGFAAVAYLRIANDDKINCVLVGAKTRVAPLKSLSIPRLELQAAVLGVRFAKVITESHTIHISQCSFWSDSKNVLGWIRSDHRRYKLFVAFRVSEILDLSEISDWRWISTKLNVADEGTKWQKAPEFKASSRWFTGPEFLKSHPSLWPNEIPPENATVEELKTCFVNLHTMNKENNFRISDTSSWRRLIRIAAYFLRFIHNTSIKRHERKSGILHKQRKGYLRQEEAELFREAQASEYRDEIADLSSKKTVEKSSILYNLCPYLDADKVIRANSRIPFSVDVGEDVKKPIILPKNHPITELVIIDLHVRFNHRNHETVINELRQKFHIAHMRSTLRLVRKNCQNCKNTRAKPQPPMMAQLPPARVAPFCRPFSFVGIVLLTCLTTRAVHLEIAHSLSADSCILALRNFMARRGTPIEIFSDNGTNFHGAERELREALKEVNTEKMMETFTTTDTKWTFIPPGSPHMGGSWERLVRSVKTSLYDIMPTRNPSDELLRSMLIEVENIVNSRPLTYIPIDDESEEALTPNHFILGSSNGSKPPTVFDSGTKVLKRNWLTSQQYAERFWQRWVREYLPTITRRTKWFTSAKPIEEGDIVLIVDPMSPRNCWPKGRVIQTTISKDGQVRSAFVQTQSGVYERPAVKLAILDVRAEKVVSPRSELPRGSVNNPVANPVKPGY